MVSEAYVHLAGSFVGALRQERPSWWWENVVIEAAYILAARNRQEGARSKVNPLRACP
jgi:hypothetical protein